MAESDHSNIEFSTNSTPTIFESEVNTNKILCSVLLNEHNYLPWSRVVSLTLGGKAKLGYVNGVVPVPQPLSERYDMWLCKDQQVMSWLLNSMEPQISEIFSYSESSKQLWSSVKEMYGNQNNAARVFQLKKEINEAQQEGKSFVHHLGTLTNLWNELNLYRPHTTDSTTLLKCAEEDKIFQLLASLSNEYEDLKSFILMNPQLSTFSSVCATIQREEVCKRVMNVGTKPHISEVRACVVTNRSEAAANTLENTCYMSAHVDFIKTSFKLSKGA